MTRKHDQSVPGHAAEKVDKIADGVRAAAHAVGESVQHAAHVVHDVADRTVRNVEQKVEEAGQVARNSLNQGRAQARVWENRLQSCVRANPLLSLLIAVGLGAVVAAVWKHKRT